MEINDMNIIEFKNVSFGYGKNAVLEDFSLRIEKGTFTAVLGRNGSGKSTLARLINGLLLPRSGCVMTCGMDTSDEEQIYNIRSRAALVFQNPDDGIVSAVVEDEAAFGAENLGIEPAEIRKRVDAALKETRLYQKRLAMTAQLSGGEKQRLAIASALVMEPEVLILDEPTSMLDPEGRREFLETVKRLAGRGMTVVLITHDMEEAAEAQRCIVMGSGKIVLDGAPVEVFADSTKLEELALCAPEMQRLAAELRRHGIDVPDDIFGTEEMANYIEGIFLRGVLGSTLD